MNRAGAIEGNLFSLGHEHHAFRFQVDDNDTAPTAIQAGFATAYTFREDPEVFLKLTLFEQRLLQVFKAPMEELKTRPSRALRHTEGGGSATRATP